MFEGSKLVSTGDDQVNNAQPSHDVMSAEAMRSVERGIFCGVMRSLAMYLMNTQADSKVVAAKILTFINALRSNQDISEDEANWQYDTYFSSLKRMGYAADPMCATPCCSNSYLSWYMIIQNLVDDVNVYNWCFGSENKSRLNEKEQGIIDTLSETQKAYWEARSAFENYFREVNQRVLKSILVKYGTVLTQIAPKWYADIKRSAGLDQPNEDPHADLSAGDVES